MKNCAGPRIDSDVHHTWKSVDEVIRYLPRQWRTLTTEIESGRVPLRQPQMSYPHSYGVNKRLDTFPATGGPPGSDYATIRRQLLDPFKIERAVLSFDIGTEPGLPNIYFAKEVVRAINDWNRDTWLSIPDDRVCSAVMIPIQVPEDAADEIRRVGADPRIVEVLMVVNGLGKPFGNPLYHPIYEAAVDMGLPVGIHQAGENQGGITHYAASGFQSTRMGFHTLALQGIQHHLASFITHGVFEKFPTLKLLLVEVGVAWVPWLLWSLDANYKQLREESPWVKKLPSEYFREHVRITTQPLEESPRRKQLIDVLEAFGGMEDILCFSTDYPHWDTDSPAYLESRLPSSWLEKVFYKNAALLYRR